MDNLTALDVKLIVMGGGEPFLRPQFLERACAEAIQRDIYPVVLTNGYMLSTRNQRAVDTLYNLYNIGVRNLSVSVDNIDDEYHSLDESHLLKSHTGLIALEMAHMTGYTDLNVTTVLDPSHPERAQRVVTFLNGKYDIRIAGLQMAEPDDNSKFQSEKYFPQARNYHLVCDYLKEFADEYRIRNAPGYFDLLSHGITYKCTDPGYITIHPTGKAQLCQNIYGKACQTVDFTKPDMSKTYLEAWYQDMLDGYCPTCSINCNYDYHYGDKT